MNSSWIASANQPGSDFPLANLPLGVMAPGRICTAIGDVVLDMHGCAEIGLLPPVCLGSKLNALAEHRLDIRRRVEDLLRAGSLERPPERLLVPQKSCRMMLPFDIGDYTDFYASIHHALRVGKLFRPDSPLLPNYKHVPIAYHGRASSVIISGTPAVRPQGQLGEGRFGRTGRLDYEVELGFYVGWGNDLGSPIPIDRAADHLFGFCLVNDWSARDIQRWEYQPLGPFLSKSFATSVTPWVVMPEALEPYRSEPVRHDVPLLPYLSGSGDYGYAITLEVYLNGDLLGRMNTRALYWTPAQMIAHHTSGGCNLRTGDLLASGTASGEETDAHGCLLESQPDGPFLQDGDEVVMRGYAESPGHPRIGFGECRGSVVS